MNLQKSLLCFWRKEHQTFLALFWFSGWAFGIWTASEAEGVFYSLMHGALVSSVSILSVFCLTFLPFLISICVVMQNVPFLLLLIAFGQSFLLAIVSFYVLMAVGSSGWLISSLFLFSELCVIPVLFIFWRRYIFEKQGPSNWEILGYCVWTLLVSCIDVRIISPFLAFLIDC